MSLNRSEYIQLIKNKKFFKYRKNDILKIYGDTIRESAVKNIAICLYELIVEWFYNLKSFPNFEKWNIATWYNMLEISKCIAIPIEIAQISGLLVLQYTVFKMKNKNGKVHKEAVHRLRESEENTNFILNNLVKM